MYVCMYYCCTDNSGFKKERASSYSFAKDDETMLQVIIDLIKRGEKSAIAALDIITEEWLEALARKAIGKEGMTSKNAACKSIERIPQIQSQLPRRAKNVGFLLPHGYLYIE